MCPARGLRRARQISARAPGVRDGRDGVFEDQLFLRARLEQDRKLIKTADSAGQLRAIQQINDHGSLFTTHRVEKGVLDILWCLFAVRHVVKPGGGLVIPRGYKEITTRIFG